MNTKPKPKPTNMLTPQMVAQHCNQIYLPHKHLRTESEFYAQNLFFISMTMDRGQTQGWRTKPNIVFDPLARWYFDLSRDAFGNNLNRKRRLQPVMYAFLDVEGTRRSMTKLIAAHGGDETTRPRHAPNRGYELLHAEVPHIHAVMITDPSQGNEFRKRVLISRQHCYREIADIELRWFDPTKSVEQLISYCMKGYEQLPASYTWREDCMQFFPR